MNKKEFENYKNFAIEVKRLVRNLGKTNFISPQDIEELIIKYNIRLE